MEVVKKDLVYTAQQYAIECHRGTNHKYNEYPYDYHLEMVFDYGVKYGHLIEDKNDLIYALAVCWTHDVIEDCRQTYNDVKNICGVQVADLTYALTNEKGRNRKERANAKYYSDIRNCPNADFVKVCDRLANIKFSVDNNHRMIDAYRKEYENFALELFRKDLEPMFEEMRELLDQK